jgi:dTDP-4-dehydrorhamnose 3,5-epimerase
VNLIPTCVEGCFEVRPKVFDDVRGRFVKTFNIDQFREHGLETHFAEQFYSTSTRRVLRGMHLQRPPMDLNKLVACVSGQVLDAVVDLRADSPTSGCHVLLPLEPGQSIYVPKGCAHGFYVTSDEATLVYSVSSIYDSECDTGVLWNSAGIHWPDDDPILSDRDRALPALAEFGWV